MIVDGRVSPPDCELHGLTRSFRVFTRYSELMFLSEFLADDRYQVLASGELLIHKTNMADKDRTYRCRVQDTVTNRILVSAKPATAHIVGKS